MTYATNKRRNPRSMLGKRAFMLGAAALSGVLVAGSAMGDGVSDVWEDIVEFVEDLEVENVRDHQWAFQRAADRNAGTRLSGTPGYNESLDYVAAQLEDAGYKIEIQNFDFLSSVRLGPSTHRGPRS